MRDDPELLVNAAEEIIRWTSPVRSVLRWAQERCVKHLPIRYTLV